MTTISFQLNLGFLLKVFLLSISIIGSVTIIFNFNYISQFFINNTIINSTTVLENKTVIEITNVTNITNIGVINITQILNKTIIDTLNKTEQNNTKHPYLTSLIYTSSINITKEVFYEQTHMDVLLPDNKSVATLQLPILANKSLEVAYCVCISGEWPKECLVLPKYDNNILKIPINYTPITPNSRTCP